MACRLVCFREPTQDVSERLVVAVVGCVRCMNVVDVAASVVSALACIYDLLI